ncbi:MAG: hypothetical protein Q7S65_06280, partial [Nanoarchaeota archaeon]|nr:hypothetical protein [Nanoarchaeota archaeon]
MPTMEETLRYVALPRAETTAQPDSHLERIVSSQSAPSTERKSAYDLFIPMGSAGLEGLKLTYDGNHGLLSIEKKERGEKSNDFFSLQTDGRYQITARYDPVKRGLAIHYESREYGEAIDRAKA